MARNYSIDRDSYLDALSGIVDPRLHDTGGDSEAHDKMEDISVFDFETKMHFHDPVTTGIGYMFFTRPLLNLVVPSHYLSLTEANKIYDKPSEAITTQREDGENGKSAEAIQSGLDILEKALAGTTDFSSWFSRGSSFLNIKFEDMINGYNNLVNNTILNTIAKTNPYVINALNELHGNVANISLVEDLVTTPFIKAFTNKAVKANDSGQLTMSVIDMNKTFDGYQTFFPTHYIESMSNKQLGVTFNETADLDITKHIMVWMEYIYLIGKGYLMPTIASRKSGYTDYYGSIYSFTLKPDGETIQMPIKYTGVTPVGLPMDMFSYQRDKIETADIAIDFRYMYKEFMSEQIMMDFNLNAFFGNFTFEALNDGNVSSPFWSIAKDRIEATIGKDPVYNNSSVTVAIMIAKEMAHVVYDLLVAGVRGVRPDNIQVNGNIIPSGNIYRQSVVDYINNISDQNESFESYVNLIRRMPEVFVVDAPVVDPAPSDNVQYKVRPMKEYKLIFRDRYLKEIKQRILSKVDNKLTEDRRTNETSAYDPSDLRNT